jgi:hypothetical protein
MQGTDSRVGRWVRDTCGSCRAEDVLVYEAGDVLMCAHCYRGWSKTQEHPQPCDECGSTGTVWRNPVTRKNEYLCAKCHAVRGQVFQNRWAVWESTPLNPEARPRCAVEDNNCRGQVRWRSSTRTSLCDRHAGKIV